MSFRTHGSLAGAAALLVLLLAASCGGDESSTGAPDVAAPAPDDARLSAADAEPGSWLVHGRTRSEQRMSPLSRIDSDNVAQLQLAWSFPTGTTRGLEATPLVVDGVMYTTGTWSVVWALDARSGELLWKFDPRVPRAVGEKACCDVVNRGVAAYRGRVYVGTLDGRLIALDAKTGKPVWEKVTVPEGAYTITGAPRVLDGKVVIGNGGAEYGVRGYVSAYAADDGKLLWRTYTVPGDPAKGFESEALEKAAATWSGEWWSLGGGGTVWDSIAYDEKLGLLYVGTGNGSPWVRALRSPGGGDNLYLSSILALDPDDGRLVWYYQTTPGDNWDFTATQHMILADLTIDGRERKVLMQAPKNGFFYVLDRQTGELISAEPYVEVTWASGVDSGTGKPVEVAGQDYEDGLAFVKPTFFGGHNWQPMSFNPDTGLVYIPAQEILGAYRRDPDYRVVDGEFNVGTDFNVFAAFGPAAVSGHLLAWDPVAQREAWRVPLGLPWNGGTLTTAGNLVFQGTADGRLVAYAADTGRTLWVAHTGTGIIAPPMTYELDGVQYVTVMAGWGGAFALSGGAAALGVKTGPGAVLTFALPAGAPTPEQLEALVTQTDPLSQGERLYHTWCARCHGAGAVSSSAIPDLRLSQRLADGSFEAIAEHGLDGTAMPAMGRYIGAEQVALIQRYLEAKSAAASPQP
jgi:quinohemoprotein ethanol dehydrogenase